MTNMERWFHCIALQKETEKKMTAVLARHHYTLNEFYVLYYLHQNPEHALRLNELEPKIDLSQSALSRMIQRMQNKTCGVIEKCTCSVDHRGIFVRMTEQGEQAFNQIFPEIDAVLQSSLPASADHID